MDPELKKALEELRGQLKNSVDVAARVDQIEARIKLGATGEDLKAVRADLEKLQKFHTEREQALKDLQEKTRVHALSRDPIQLKRSGIEMMGMMARSLFMRRIGSEHPAEFRGEVDLVRKYQEEMLARATLTPMSTTGSYVVPTVTALSIEDAVEAVSGLLGLVDFQPGLPAGGTFNYTYLATRPTAQKARASSDTSRTQSDPVLAQLQLTPKEMYVTFPVDNKFFVMSPLALGTYFQGLCRDSLIARLVYWLIRADGSSTYNSITGLLAEATADYVYYLPAGKTKFADATALDYGKARANNFARGRGPAARWLLGIDIQDLAEEIDRTGKNPLIREREDGSYRIKNIQVQVEEDMPGESESAVSTGFAVVGDLKTILVGMVGGMRVRSDSSVGFKEDQTWFAADTVVDIKRKAIKSLTVMKTAAA